VFSSHEYGIRALALLLTTYQDRHGLRSIRQLINRWAPPVENVTSAYVNHVAALTGRDPDVNLDLHRYADLRPLVEAIITHELGGQPYSAAVIDEGLRLAGVKKPAATLAAAASTTEGKAALSWAGLVTAAGAAVPAVEAVSGLPQWVGVALVVSVAAVALAVVLTRRQDLPA
jgi:VIT1/CCC1 family predicted Fe2+/Mn2+ transporter